ncbi:MAG: STAS domain-containing protein [Pyrinomonadaceae bacterium]
MATQINQVDDDVNCRTTLKVAGELFSDDAKLLEKISVEIRSETGNQIVIDLADLDFIDSEAAPILRRLENLDGFELQGMEIFLQTIVNSVERTSL